MAHIADCLFDSSSGLGLNNYIARELSPQRPRDEKSSTPPPETPSTEKEKFVWRMLQPAEPRKYQIFPPKEKPSLVSGRKTPEWDSTSSSGQYRSLDKDRTKLGTALRLKTKDQPLLRRRKISMTEIGAMTTVQEIPMDSPTVPGRPPLHERSNSAPGNSWRQNVFGESMLSGVSGPAFDELAELTAENMASVQGQASNSRSATPKPLEMPVQRQPLSPKSLAPLIIPHSSAPLPRLAEQDSKGDETPGPVVPPKSARMLEFSPSVKSSGSKPSPAPATAPNAVATSIFSAKAQAKQPNSAPSGRSSPQPWSATLNFSPYSQGRSQTPDNGNVFSHRRGASEGTYSVMDRGRPKRRLDASPSNRMHSASVSESTSEERKAFEALPQSSIPAVASASMSAEEIADLRMQAIGQATRFGVLSPKDVDKLSRELRSLDERCEYLRKTLRNLTSGRQNLQERICMYLRSPRLAQFSHESLLKQEEALSELNISIDDWIAKRDRAENRRTRVRQKLLEHVAAALMLEPQQTPPEEETKAEASVQDMQMRGQYTPPHSPTKSNSPMPLAAPLEASTPEPVARADVESIRIYADSDMFALLADVEEEINRIGE
ncbi:hypothetical protein OIDMADRAFT_99080, partial [Oidiodendron maius Zn]